jgi:hypothetical protein
MLNMAKYCKDKGMDIKEYKQFQNNIKETAKAIRSQLTYNGGMYYNVSDLFNWNCDEVIKCFIIQELKQLDIEFFQDNELYRVCC